MAELTIMLRKTLGGLTGVDVVHVFFAPFTHYSPYN